MGAGVRRSTLSALLVAFGIALLACNWAYFKGFDHGADASLCVFAIQHFGNEEAMKERACQAISGLKPPPRLFPGSTGEEPTIWNGR